MPPDHIILLCSRLDLPGGIERAIVDFANLFSSKGEKITIIILDETDKCFYPLSPKVNIIQRSYTLGISNKGTILSRKLTLIIEIWKIKRLLKKLKGNYIIATDFPFIVTIVFAANKKKSKLFSWEHHEHTWLKKNKFWRLLLKYCYPRLTKVICLNKIESTYYNKFTSATIIPYYIDSIDNKKSPLNTKTILSIGWLIPRKGIDLLMIAAEIILKKHTDWVWKIIGKGEMEEELNIFIKEKKLANKLIVQKPISHDLSQEYYNASIFAHAARIEVFGLVIAEAMSYGVPCVSFDCPSGPAEIITSNEDGLLVEKENVTQLVEAISFLISNEDKRIIFGNAAYENRKRFSPETIYNLWKEKIFT